ncbi:RNA polymerase sigma factor [Pseudomonas sp. 3A(2025)]
MTNADALSDAASASVRTLYLDHHAWLINWLRKRLHPADGAADLAQDTFVHLLGRPQLAVQLQAPRAWLGTVARGLLVDRVRRQRYERAYLEALSLAPEAEAPSAQDQYLMFELLTRIDALLDGLAPNVRSAFLLSRLEGLTYSAIAAQLKVSVPSVEKYIAKAVRHCYLAQL